RWANVHDEAMVLMASGMIALVATAITDRLRSNMFESRGALELERARSRQLLDNVLPATVAERMLDFGCNDPSGICVFETFADHFEEVSILFADIVGFTALSSKLPPAALLHGLNDIFVAFDAIADELGVYKVKTIGDAYMVAAGVPEARDDHAAALAEMAVRMLAHVEANPLLGEHPLQLRIGIHSGPVVAGVIGLTGFTYDVWGDTVNVASRMESHGVVGAVQVSDTTAQALQGTSLSLEPRGEMEVKGKGLMRTWLVEGRRGAEVERLTASA
ncbi:MAG: adenylate/guanylate cyclase domain-containing protein, partial [Myxococcota bacterium]|nr:adenylate/guanylate cyclase domain-containing protein [Myxococcota bacterium]